MKKKSKGKKEITNIGPIKVVKTKGDKNFYPIIDHSTTNKHLSNDTSTHHNSQKGESEWR